MKKKQLFLIGFFILLIFGGFFGAWKLLAKDNQPEPITTGHNATVWVLSDTHFISDKLHDNGEKFTYMMHTAASKDLKYQSVSLKSFVQETLKKKPDAVIITGDVTFNGEQQSIDDLAEYFKPLQQAKIKVLAIPGNHDIYDGWARKFKGNQELKTEQISPTSWKNTFKDGYQNVLSTDPDSLSSSIQLDDDYQLILLDSNYYTIQPSNQAPATNGYLRDETIKWLESQLKKGKEHHLRPIIFLHHNLLEHTGRRKGGYILDNIDQVKPLLKKYDVKLAFAGHIHAQDIAHDILKEVPTTEVLSGSFAVTPQSYGVVKFSQNKIEYDKQILNITPYLTKNQKKNPDLANHQAYLKKLFFDDTKAIIYDRLYYKLKDQPEQLDQAAEVFAEINWHFFTGTDNLTKTQINKIINSPGYQTLIKYGGMQKGYAENALSDQNEDDNHLIIKY